MVSKIGIHLARMGGGDKDILDEVPQERMRFVQMAGVLLTTAGVATLSMMFALHNGLRAPLAPSIIFGLLWGVVIFNIDRFLVLSMGDTRTRGWRLLGIMLPRFLLAALLAAVVSTPLVLRIFQSDINQQLSIMHQQQSKAFFALVNNSADQQRANALKRQIDIYQATLNGHPPQNISSPQLTSSEKLVTQLIAKEQTDFTTANETYGAWQCEIRGQTCHGGSGQAGNGALAHQKYQAYVRAKRIYDSVRSQRLAAERTANSERTSLIRYQSQRLSQLKQQAKQALPGLQGQYKTLENRIQNTIKMGDITNEANTGILAQLQALSQASSKNSGLAAARWTVLLLFFAIEILPVTVKALLNLGSQTPYEKVAVGKEEAIADREDLRRIENREIEEGKSRARVRESEEEIRLSQIESQTELAIAERKAQRRIKVQEDMRLREEDLGAHANQYVADEMSRIIEKSLKEWGDRIRDKLSGAAGESGNGQVGSTKTETKKDFKFRDEDSL